MMKNNKIIENENYTKDNVNHIHLYKNLNLKNGQILKNVNWGRKENLRFSQVHSISSYLAMFAPALPEYFIKKYSKENDVIMDNFSGRGTTALVARELKRKFIGNDLNPYAYVISKFKTDVVSKKEILKTISYLKKKYNESKYNNYNYKIDYNEKNNKELSYFYSDKTLRQLIFLREICGKKWLKNNKNINAVLSYALGLMHGPMKKNNSTIYFSLKMPNTISMSPNYVKKYADKNKLVRPDVDIFVQIKNRVNDKYDSLLEKKFNAKIYCCDSTEENVHIKNKSIDLVITSPPYLSIVNYTRSNWLKLWLLGYERSDLKSKIHLSDSLKFDEYKQFIKNYLLSIHPKLKNKAKVCLIVGDVFQKKLIEEVWRNIENKIKYKFIEIYYDYKYSQNKKVTNMLKSRAGKATKVDKVLVIEKY